MQVNIIFIILQIFMLIIAIIRMFNNSKRKIKKEKKTIY